MDTETKIKIITAVIAFITALISFVGVLIKRKKGKDNEGGSDDMPTNDEPNINQNANLGNTEGDSNTIISNARDVTVINNSTENKQTDSQEENTTQNSTIETKLASAYTSLFAEDNRLKSEQIRITKQENGVITGEVILQDINHRGKKENTFTYSLSGRFYNKVLTAEYFSTESRIDERGAINLKLIDGNILSGFCSFSKTSTLDDEIRSSPYVWVAGENKDLLNGTFDFCTECFNEKSVCCCANERIDMPVFFDFEINNIRNQLAKHNQPKDNFSSLLEKPFQETIARQMRKIDERNDKGEITSTKCHFFDIENQQCKIYEGRPVDCRLFPFDVKLMDNKTEYIIGYYPALCDRKLPDERKMKKYAHILRPYFFLLYPYLHIITSDVVCPKLKNAEFRRIASFQDFVF